MNDKIILVFYISVKHVRVDNRAEFVDKWSNLVKDSVHIDNKKILSFIIPTEKEETRVEMVNKPVFVVDEEYKKEIDKKYEKLEQQLSKIINNDNVEDKEVE